MAIEEEEEHARHACRNCGFPMGPVALKCDVCGRQVPRASMKRWLMLLTAVILVICAMWLYFTKYSSDFIDPARSASHRK